MNKILSLCGIGIGFNKASAGLSHLDPGWEFRCAFMDFVRREGAQVR